ncbi:unnamed protein product [Paramecium sonneborni]|uniref:Uncharacterized protein n=1 Tax=Paramecium sonneborni TaxID=65129 RepID=A0A8S1RGJ1_9CILI|nr:unnamed protein product [Paramecium sonneborni]
MIFLLLQLSFLHIVVSYIDLDTSLTNHRFSAADLNNWKFVYRVVWDGVQNNAVSLYGLSLDRNTDLERSQCLTLDGSCTDINAVQYVGLGLIGQFGGAFKTFENLPPHCQIYFSVDMAIKGKSVPPSKLYALIDTLAVAVYTVNPGSQEFFYESVTLSGIFSHNSPFLIIEFASGFFVNHDRSMGIRNIKIQYTPCPVGCQICSIKETQTQCSQWILNYQGIRFGPTISNDGWQITNLISITNPQQIYNLVSYTYCLSPGLGPFGQNQDVTKSFFLDPHYEVRFVFYLITQKTDTRFPHVIVVRIDGLEVHSFNIKSVDPQINFCQWESYDHNVRKAMQMTKKVDFNLRNNKRQITFSLQIQSISVPIIVDQILLKDFQVFIKKCYSEPNFSCDECAGPEKQDCIQKAQLINFQQIASKDFAVGHGWQVILPEVGGVQICNSKPYFGLDSTKVTTYQIQKFFTINEPHQEIEISFTINKIDKYIAEKFQIFLDDVMLDEILFSTAIGEFSQCGSSDIDGQINYYKKIAHTRTLSLITIKSTQTTTTGIYGIFNFKLKIRNGLESTDLYKDLISGFNTNSNNWNDWVITKLSNDLSLYICDSSVTLLGKLQPEMQIRRFITNIAIHTQMKIEFTLYLFTNQFDGKNQYLILNNQTIWNQKIKWFSQKTCNDNLDTFIIKGDILIKHDLDYAFFIWKSSVINPSASWGITEFNLFIS